MKSKILGLLAVGLLAGPVAANAAYIFDTGSGSSGWVFTSVGISPQWFAGEFSVSSPVVVGSVEIQMVNAASSPGSVTVAVHADGGNIPGAVLFTQSFGMAAVAPFDWYGLSGLSWSLGSGTYWVSFTPDAWINGAVGSDATSPLSEYAQNQGNGWLNFGANWWDFLKIPMRMGAAPVPEPGTLALLGLGLLGLGVTRRKAA